MMSKQTIHSLLLSLLALCLGASLLGAQNIKTIAVSNDQSYTDHLSLAQDSRDMDVMVKFIFDEGKNTLTVSLVSYRSLFVFQEDTRYSSVVRGSRLHPEKLPYVAQAEDGTRFNLSRALRKALPRPLNRYVFNRWISYDGLQPVPTDYKMVNDFIEQTFDIQGKRNSVTVTLRDVFLLDPSEGKPNRYILSRGKDLLIKYQVVILRNPCLGMDEEIASAQKQGDAVQKAFETLKQVCPKGEVTSEEALKTFQDTQSTLLSLYPPKDTLVACPDLAMAVKQYNAYVDSLARLTCKLVEPGDASWDDGQPLDVKLLYTQTRQLDKAVARWLVTKDDLEKKDLVSQCEDIIKDVSAMVRLHKASSEEEKQAIQAYNQAEEYFRKTCKP